jgi:hypothetical protein
LDDVDVVDPPQPETTTPTATTMAARALLLVRQPARLDVDCMVTTLDSDGQADGPRKVSGR